MHKHLMHMSQLYGLQCLERLNDAAEQLILSHGLHEALTDHSYHLSCAFASQVGMVHQTVRNSKNWAMAWGLKDRLLQMSAEWKRPRHHSLSWSATVQAVPILGPGDNSQGFSPLPNRMRDPRNIKSKSA